MVNGHIDCVELNKMIKYAVPINNPWLANPNILFIIDKKKLPYSVLQRIYEFANLNKKWLKFSNLFIYQFAELIHRNNIVMDNENVIHISF